MPPCPGMESPKSLILNPRLKPDAKKPPKGAMMDANIASTTACSCAAARPRRQELELRARRAQAGGGPAAAPRAQVLDGDSLRSRG